MTKSSIFEHPIYIVIVGQVRHLGSFIKTLEVFEKFCHSGIVSKVIWVIDYKPHDSIDARWGNSDWLSILRLPSVGDEFVEKFDPQFLTRDPGPRQSTGGMRRGTMFRQFRSFRLGLDKVPVNSWILKTRADIRLSESALKKIFSQKPLLGHPYQGENSKIWVQWASLQFPLYIQDTLFFTHRLVADRLVTRSFNLELAKNYYPTSPLPTLWWMNLAMTNKFWDLYFKEIKDWYLKYGHVDSREITGSELSKWLEFVNENLIILNFRGIWWHLQWSPNVGKRRIWLPVRFYVPTQIIFNPSPLVRGIFAAIGHATPQIAESNKIFEDKIRKQIRRIG